MLLDFLNMGTPELILIIICLFFISMFFLGIILLIKYVFKKKDSFDFPTNHYTVNLSGGNGPLKAENITPTAAVALKEKGNVKIVLPMQSEIRYVEVPEIIRCEADDNYTKFVLKGEQILISKSLKEYDDLLKPHHFIRTHQSHLINPLYVRSWLKEDGGTLLMQNGDKIPVSKPNRELVKMMLAK